MYPKSHILVAVRPFFLFSSLGQAAIVKFNNIFHCILIDKVTNCSLLCYFLKVDFSHHDTSYENASFAVLSPTTAKSDHALSLLVE